MRRRLEAYGSLHVIGLVNYDKCRHSKTKIRILVTFLLCVQISFEGFFGDFEALFREIGTMYVIQSIAYLFLLPLTIFQAAYGYRV